MLTWLAQWLTTLPKLTPLAVIDILVTAFLIYQLLMIIRGRRAVHVIVGVVVLIGLYVAAFVSGMELVRRLLATLAPYTAFALIVMFQSELRRMLARIGRRGWIGIGSRLKRRELVQEILQALDQLIENQDRRTDRAGARQRATDVHRKRSGAGRGAFTGSAAGYFPSQGCAARRSGDYPEREGGGGGLLSAAEHESDADEHARHPASRGHRHHGRNGLPEHYRLGGDRDHFGGGVRRDGARG